MKVFFFIVLMISVGLFSACEKLGSSSIEGRWSVVSDSSIISGGTTSYNVYNGNAADYFIFKDGNLSVRENSQLSTFSYQIKSPSTITIIETESLIYPISQSGPYTFTGNKLRIEVSSNATNPGFSFSRIINLKR